MRLLAGTGNNQGQALTLQSDGRILIAGGAVHERQRLRVRGRAPHGGRPARYDLDAHGRRTTTLGATGYATAIAPSASGFVVAGRRADAAMGNAYLDVVVTRYVGGP